jgi:DNA-directed RNA polymerase subunit RPC12/RpoP
MKLLVCSKCGKAVSTPVPDNTIVRAWIECPECIKKEPEEDKK